MNNVLIVSSTDKSISFLKELLGNFRIDDLTTVKSGQKARQLFLEQDFDITIINAPLIDETGEKLSIDIALKYESQVVLIVKSDIYDDVSMKVEDVGVITMAKPINRALFWSTLKVANATSVRFKSMKAKNTKLVQKIDDIKIIDRAKYILITNLKMSENDAHKYIEKQAMDHRVSKRSIAEKILKTYEN